MAGVAVLCNDNNGDDDHNYRALSHRADGLEESVGNGYRDGEGINDGEINLVLRQKEEEREEEDW